MTRVPPAGARAPAPHQVSTPRTALRRLALYRLAPRGAHLAPPLELASLAAHLRAVGGLELDLHDLAREDPETRVALGLLEDCRPEALVAWAEPGAHAELVEFLRLARTASPELQVAVAGPEIAHHAAILLELGAADVVARPGEELGVVDWIRALREGATSPEGCRGLVHRGTDGRTIREAVRALPADLDREPLPAWDLVDVTRYFTRPGSSTPHRFRRKWAPISTSRACPPGCGVCHSSYGRVQRARGPASVMEEIDRLVDRFGVQEVVLFDEVPNHDPVRLRYLLEALAGRHPGLSLSFKNGLRGDFLGSQDPALLRAAGVREVSLVVETTSPRLQREMKLNVDLAATLDAAESLEKSGISTRGLFTLGLPTETAKEREETVRFATISPFTSVRFRDHTTGETSSSHARLIPPAPGGRTLPARPWWATVRSWLHPPRWRRTLGALLRRLEVRLARGR